MLLDPFHREVSFKKFPHQSLLKDKPNLLKSLQILYFSPFESIINAKAIKFSQRYLIGPKSANNSVRGKEDSLNSLTQKSFW